MAGKPVVTVVLRVLAVAAFLIAFIVLLLSSQKQDSTDYDVGAYQQWTGLKFCVIVDCIGFVYNLIVVFIPAGSQLWKTFVVFDVIMNILVGAKLGSGWQTYLLIKQGNVNASWCSICDVFPFFCDKVVGSLITSTIGFLISFVLLMSTINVTADPFLISQ